MPDYARSWLLVVAALLVQGCQPSAAPPAQAGPIVPKGTVLTVNLGTSLSSETSRVGDLVVVTLMEPLSQDGVTVAPAGTELRGRVTATREAGKLKGRSRLAFELNEIVVGGRRLPISAAAVDLSGASQKKKNIVAIGGGTGVGAAVGAIAGGKKGAAIGAAVGAGVGTGAAALKGGEQITLAAGQTVSVELTAPFSAK